MINQTSLKETLILDRIEIPLYIITKRKQHISFRFINGILWVSAPLIYSIVELKNALLKKKTWILKHYALSEGSRLKDDEIRLHDRKLRLVDQIGSRFAYSFTFDTLTITHPLRMTPATALQKFKKEYSHTLLPVIFASACRETGLHPSALSIRQTRSSHGRCNSKKQITLSSGLIAYSQPYIRYVCIHELAHLKHMNHSPAFYALVVQYCPDYKKLVAHVRSAVL